MCGTDLSVRGKCVYYITAAECAAEEEDYFECLQAYDCPHTDSLPYLPGSCANINCRCLRVKYDKCRRSKFSELYGNQDPEYFAECPASRAAASLALVLLVVGWLLLF
jgi:hypothetical protein